VKGETVIYWFDKDGLGRERLYHSCHRGERQLCPSPSTIVDRGYDEDGYFRGLRAGRSSHMFKGSPYTYNVIRCKGCGEEFRW